MALELQYQYDLIEAGLDEAGRGCLAGPVVAAAVILPEDFQNDLLNDSKKLSLKNRIALREIIQEQAVSYAVSFVDAREIEKINILNASIKAMNIAASKLQVQPDFLAVDGNRFQPDREVSFKTIVKGDGKYLNIAAASILAKTARDDYMKKIAKQFPYYQWEKNQGYPTKSHREAIAKYGPCEFHRKTFKLLPDQLTLDLVFETK